jgi:dihydrofolate synthase/folylpolyglutamate synthase
MLEAGGLSAHVYTSPNLVRVNERFRLGRAGGGVLVADDDLAAALAECERANGDAPITVFEIETAAAFLLFSRHPADALLLEVGLGGRLDATNVIEHPVASVVTPVSMDHMEFLGDTLEAIAAEKAAILKKDVPAVIGRQTEGPLSVIVDRAERVGAPLHVLGQDWTVTEERGRLVYQDLKGLIDLPGPRLFGRHQFDNAGTAIAALRASGLALPTSAFEQGIVKAEWPARLQRLTSGKLPPLAPAGSELWLDGSHNADGGRITAAFMADLEERVPRPLVLVVGMLSTKDTAGFLRNFTGLARRLIAVPIHQDKGLPTAAVADVARMLGLSAESADTIETALSRVARLDIEAPPRILVTGSLYLAGEVLAANGTPPA